MGGIVGHSVRAVSPCMAQPNSDYARLTSDKAGDDKATPTETLQVNVEDEQDAGKKMTLCQRPWWRSAVVCGVLGLIALLCTMFLLPGYHSNHHGFAKIDHTATDGGGLEGSLKERAERGIPFQMKASLIDSLMGKSNDDIKK